MCFLLVVLRAHERLEITLLEALPAQFLLTATRAKPHGLTHTLEPLLLSPLPIMVFKFYFCF